MMEALYRRVYEATNHRLRWAAGGRLASRCGPTSIIFLVTERCNARCTHCNIWQNRGQEDSPTLEQWTQVVTDIRQWLGPVMISFSGGEALLKPWALELVAHAVQQGLFVEHLTHGYWLDQKVIERLALTNPGRITMSMDGVGATHDVVRGRANFFERSSTSLATLGRMRKEHALRYTIRLKTVIMAQNVAELGRLAKFAESMGAEIFYQAVEQNYNSVEDPRWYESSPNWPRDSRVVTQALDEIVALKRAGLPIMNTEVQLEAMREYFLSPDSLRVAVQSHSAHEERRLCAGLTMLQFQANGDVTVCSGLAPVGNVKRAPVRQIWADRLPVLAQGCCLDRRLTTAERERILANAK